jgi:hypothetical protein
MSPSNPIGPGANPPDKYVATGASGEATPASAGDETIQKVPLDAEGGVIEVHLHSVNQLFDSLDPSPFRERDLDPDADEYIVESLKELPSGAPCTLLVHLDQSIGISDPATAMGNAIRAHFARRAQVLKRNLRLLMRRGLVSLSIGLAFLAMVFAIAHGIEQWMGQGALAKLLREGFVIAGWVAMWRPLEIFLYDWWPILGEQRVNDRLSRIDVQVVAGQSRESGTNAGHT